MTGNYAFFNLLSIGLCLLLIDDAAIGRATERLRPRGPAAMEQPPAASSVSSGWGPSAGEKSWALPRSVVAAAAVLTVPVSIVTLADQAVPAVPGSAVIAPCRLYRPLASVNPYGLFAVMTTTRPEIVVEGSNDGVTWRPTNSATSPATCAGRRASRRTSRGSTGRCGSPRSAGFDQEGTRNRASAAGLSKARRMCWRSSRAILFRGKPPRLLRAVLYHYHFADRATRRAEARLVGPRGARGP